MTTQTPSIAIPSPRRGLGHRLFLGLGAAALAVAVGVGLWQVERRDTTDIATRPATLAPPAVARPLESAPTVYLLGTAAQAAAVQRGIGEAAAIRAELGEHGAEDEVLLVASAEGEARLRLLTELDAIRAERGLPPLRFIDLRAPAATAAPVAGQPVVQLVGLRSATS